MNRRVTLAVASIAALGLLLPSSAFSQQKSLKEQLVGAWTLVSAEATASNGTKGQPYGANPKGILILDPSGQYAMVQGRPDRAKLKTANRLEFDASETELKATLLGFAANFGPWSVNEAEKTLIRRYESAVIPNNEGTEFKASISLSGDQLTLTQTSSVTGVRTDTVYRRVK